MSNKPEIQNTMFVNLNPDGSKAGEVSYGVRVYDDYESHYNNTMETSTLPTTPEEALRVISEMSPEIYDSIVSEDGGGFFFCNEWVKVDGNGSVINEG